jgi:hypothetical protein
LGKLKKIKFNGTIPMATTALALAQTRKKLRCLSFNRKWFRMDLSPEVKKIPSNGNSFALECPHEQFWHWR